MDASVVIPAYNAEKTISACINSLRQQNFSGLYEIIVIDNNSVDKTLDIAKKSGVKVLKEPVKGSYKARNLGAINSRGNIICFLDADCKADKNWLREIVKPFNEDSVSITGGRTVAWITRSQMQKYCGSLCNIQEASHKAGFFGAGNMAISREAFFEAGRFPEIESGGDVEICALITEKGGNLSYAHNAIVRHMYPDSITWLARKHFYYGRMHEHRKKRINMGYSVQMPSYREVLKKGGCGFVMLRLIQDFSYHLGKLRGRI